MTGLQILLPSLVALVMIAKDEAVEPRCRRLIHPWHDMLVRVGGERVGVMPESFLDDFLLA